MKQPATRGGVAGAAASGGQAKQKQGAEEASSGAEPEASQAVASRVDWSQVTAAQPRRLSGREGLQCGA